VGGHCIAVDPWFIVSAVPEEARIIRTAREVNDSKPRHVIDLVKEACADLDLPVVACLGLAFKANIDDLRESPAVAITKDLAAELPSAQVLAVEPHIRELPAQLASLDNIKLASVDEAMETADVLVVLVDHQAFKSLDPEIVATKKVVDTRGLLRR